MPESERIELVRRFIDAYEASEFEQVREAVLTQDDWNSLAGRLGEFGALALEVIDPEIVVDMRHYPWADRTTYEGYPGWLEFWRTWLEPWEQFSFTQSSWEELGDDVLVELAIAAQGRGSGVPVNLRACQHWRVRDGRIVGMGLFETRGLAIEAIRGAEA